MELLRSASRSAVKGRIFWDCDIGSLASLATPVIVWSRFWHHCSGWADGLLVDPAGGPHALGEAILRVLRDKKGANEMGLAGYQHARTTYSWQAVANVYLQAYEYAIRHAKLV